MGKHSEKGALGVAEITEHSSFLLCRDKLYSKQNKLESIYLKNI
jgi:hypothetical protein